MYSAAAGDILERRSSSRRASFLTSSGMPAFSIFSRSSLYSRCWSSPSPELLLDGLHLLAQVVLALVLLQLGLDLALDLVADLEHLEVLDQHLVEPLQARPARRGSRASPASAAVVRRGQAGRDEVGQAAGLLDVGGQRLQLVGEGGGELHHPLEQALRALGQRLDLDLLLGRDDVAAAARCWPSGTGGTGGPGTSRKRCTPWTTRRSDPSGNLNILWMWVRVPDPVEVALHRVVHRRVPLGDHADDLALAHRVVHERHRALPRHRQRQDGVREQDGVPQRQDGQLRRHLGEVDLAARRPTRSPGCVRPCRSCASESSRRASVAGPRSNVA